MRGTINLKHPIDINGEKVTSISYDTEKISVQLYAEADARKRVSAGKNVVIAPAVEFDFGLHPFMGFAAAMAENPQYDFSDMERLHGSDLIPFAEAGRNFLLKSEDVASETSDEQSETMPENSTRAQQTLNVSE